MLNVSFAIVAVSLAAPPSAPDYRRDVEPIFKQYCTGCHSSADREGKLSLEKFDELLRGGAGGVVVVPERPELSRLLLVLDGREKPAMPPEGNEGPKPEEIAVLKRWIEAGAKGPTGQAPDPTILVTPKVPLSAPARDAITAVALSPAAGGPAAIGSYGTVRLVATDDQATLRTLSGIRGSVTDLEFSKDGKLLVTAAGEPGVFGEAQLWNVADGKLVRTFTAHRDSLYAVAISPDATLIATGSYDQTIKLWDAATGNEKRTLTGHNGAIFDLAFHPQGRVLASAGADRTIKLWEVAGGKRLDTLGQPLKEQYAVAFSPDGKTLVAGGADNRIRAYAISPNAAENANPLTITRYAHEGAIIKLAYSADGKTLVSAGEDRMIRVFNAAKLTERKSLDRQADWAPGLALSPDAKQLLVGRMDGTFAFYDTATAKIVPPAAPELTAVSPRGVERGKSTRVTLAGKHLAGVTKVTLNDAEGKAMKAPVKIIADGRTPTAITVELTPAAALARGSYQVTVTAPGGTGAAQTLLIDDLPQTAEVEPNNSAPKTKPTDLEAGYWGVCAMPGDVDHVRFSAKQGQTVVCRLEAKSLGSMLDGVLTVLNADGEVAAANNDFDEGQDPLVAYRVPQDGVYAIRVNDQTMNGSDKHFYRLSVGTFPLVTGVFPTNVTVGRETPVEFTGFNLPANSMAKIKAAAAGDVMVPLDTEALRVVKTPKVRAVVEVASVEHEPNDDVKQPTTVATPAFVDGRIYHPKSHPGTDVDLFRFESKKGQTWIIETEARRRGSPTDTTIEVLDAAGKPVPRMLLQAVLDSYVTFRSVNSNENDCRLFNWREMDLEQFVYISGDVAKVFRLPQGPDSGFRFYNSANKRRGYFDTSPVAHALDEPAYVVEPHPVGAKLVNNGLPVFTMYHENDDDGLRKLGSDSRLTFTAPADGAYLVRVADVRGFGGDRYHYRLAIREPKPDFIVKQSANAPAVSAGSGTTLTFSVDRIDGFEEEITVDVTGLPEGYTLSPVRIQAGHDEAQGVLTGAADAKSIPDVEWAKVMLVARAELAGSPIEPPISGFTKVKLAAKPKLAITLEPAELTIAPGTMITAKLKIDRGEVTERIAFDVLNLPHGVIVDNIGLNGILIPEGQSEREIFLTCYDWVPDTERPFFAVSKTARAGDKAVGAEASKPVLLKVRKPSTLVKADEAKP